jgi:hypothetical protein
MRLRITVALAIALLITIANQSRAAVIYSTTGSTYSQSFDSLPSSPTNTSLQATVPWTDDSTSSATQTSLLGWYLYHPNSQAEGGANGHQRIRAITGNSGTGSFYSFGVASANGPVTDRALGDVGSTTLSNNPPAVNNMYWAVRLTNGTSDTLTTLTIQYTGEQWRRGTATGEAISVSYTNAATTDATNWADQTATNADFISVPALQFSSPTLTPTDSTLDGNAPANRATKSAIVGLSWAPGTDLWIRFNEPQLVGNDDGLAIDDFSVSVDVPEPSSLMLLSVAIVGLGLTIRRSVG